MKNRIITPIKPETVGRSPRFIGSLVSNTIVTIIADTFKYLVHTCPNFLQLQIHIKYATEYSFIIVSLCSKISLTHFV